MKKMLFIAAVLLLFAASGAQAQDDVSIDENGNMQTGVSNTDGNLEVTAADGEDAIVGIANVIGDVGVYGINTTNGSYGTLGNYNTGVAGYGSSSGSSEGVYGEGNLRGVSGYSFSGEGVYGLSNGGKGIWGKSYSGYGVYGSVNSAFGWAGYFSGNTRVTGDLTVDGAVSGPNIGDITGVTAGTGLIGGGDSGGVTLDVQVPLSLSGSAASPGGIINGTNSGTGSGVYGINTTNGNYGTLGGYNNGVTGYGSTSGVNGTSDLYGVSGYSFPGTGVYGTSNSGKGVEGYSNTGYGVYGSVNTSYGWAGYFSGKVRVTGNLTVDGAVSGPNIGDITGVTAGTGLTGGGDSGGVTLDVDTSAIQQRITGTCAAGSSIRVVNADGTVTCEIDDNVVGSITTNDVPKWDGSSLVTGTIFDNGNVGIGSPSPSEKLELTGNLKFSTGADRSIMLPDGTKSLFIGNGTPPWSIWMKSASYLSFETAGSERLRIKSDGRVGIGTTNPSEQLEVSGNVKVDGNITWTAKTGYYSVPAAAFIPRLDTTTYVNEGYTLFGFGGTAPYEFHAPVSLPQGATVTAVTFYWKDGSASGDGTLRLKRSLLSDTSTTDYLVTLTTSGSAGTNSQSSTTAISYAYIDNSAYVYYLDMTFYALNINLNTVKIEYTYTEL